MDLVKAPWLALAISLIAAPQTAGDPHQGSGSGGQPALRTRPTLGLTRMNLGEQVVDVYFKKPQGEGTWPGLVLLHDSMGLGQEMIGTADRLVAERFVVIAPDLFRGKIPLDPDKARELTTLMSEEEALGAIDAVAAFLKQIADVGDHRVGLVGFDLGGRLALRGAMGSHDVSAVVVAYGEPPVDADALRRIGCPILGLFGAKDELIPVKDAAAFRALLSSTGRSAEVKVFDDAGHGFMKDGDPAFKAGPAGEAWARMVAFLRENL